jgi:fatty acid desaturase
MSVQEPGGACVTKFRNPVPTLREHVIPQTTNAVKILLLVAALLTVFVAMDRLAGLASEDAFSITVRGAALLGVPILAIVASVLMLSMAILAHDGIHRVLFRSAAVNDLVSGLLSAFGSGVPFYANRQFHLAHHAHTHQGDQDPEHAINHGSFWRAFFVGPFVGIVSQYRLMLGNLWRREPKFLARALKDFGFIAAAAMSYTAGLSALGVSALNTILPVLLVFPFTFSFRNMSDHFGLPRAKTKSERRREIVENGGGRNESIARRSNQQVSGRVIITAPWLEWLWNSVNYHEVHHRFPYLSHAYLKHTYAATRDTYPYQETQGYFRLLMELRNRKYYSEE